MCTPSESGYAMVSLVPPGSAGLTPSAYCAARTPPVGPAISVVTGPGFPFASRGFLPASDLTPQDEPRPAATMDQTYGHCTRHTYGGTEIDREQA